MFITHVCLLDRCSKICSCPDFLDTPTEKKTINVWKQVGISFGEGNFMSSVWLFLAHLEETTR